MSDMDNDAAAAFNSAHQTRFNGELTVSLRARIKALMASSSKMSLASIAREIELSPTFTSGLVRGEKAIRTRHMPRVVAALERLERQAATRSSATSRPIDTNAPTSCAKLIELMAEVAATLPPTDRSELLRRIAMIV